LSITSIAGFAAAHVLKSGSAAAGGGLGAQPASATGTIRESRANPCHRAPLDTRPGRKAAAASKRVLPYQSSCSVCCRRCFPFAFAAFSLRPGRDSGRGKVKVRVSLRRILVAVCAGVLARRQAPGPSRSPSCAVQRNCQTSGLVLDLPASGGTEYHVSGSWASNVAGDTFDTRDIVDEIEIASGKILKGNWILSGYFTAGDCTKTIAEAKLDNAWTQDVTLWGSTWKVRGGVFTSKVLWAARPAAVLCRATQLRAHAHAVSFPDGSARDQHRNPLSWPASAAPLCSRPPTSPTRHDAPARSHRRAVLTSRIAARASAVRTVELPASGLSVDLPDGGYFWMVSEGDGVDIFDRLLPTFPEVTAELVFANGFTCKDILSSLTTDLLPNSRPTGLPTGSVGRSRSKTARWRDRADLLPSSRMPPCCSGSCPMRGSRMCRTCAHSWPRSSPQRTRSAQGLRAQYMLLTTVRRTVPPNNSRAMCSTSPSNRARVASGAMRTRAKVDKVRSAFPARTRFPR